MDNTIAMTSAAPRTLTGLPTLAPSTHTAWPTYVPTTVGTHASPLNVGIDAVVRDRFAAKQAGPPRGVPR